MLCLEGEKLLTGFPDDAFLIMLMRCLLNLLDFTVICLLRLRLFPFVAQSLKLPMDSWCRCREMPSTVSSVT